MMAGAGIMAMLLGVMTAFGTAPNTETHHGHLSEVVERLGTPGIMAEQHAPTATVLSRETRIRSGDTVSALFARMGIDDAGALAFLQNDRASAVMFRQLVPGRTLTAGVALDGTLDSLVFPLNGGNSTLKVWRTQHGFAADTQGSGSAYEKTIILQSATIRHSLFGAADDAGIPEIVATRLADIFGGDIDFHRDLRKGDRFSVVYESVSHQGKVVRAEQILAAEFVNDNRTHRAFWYQDKDGGGGYYTESGQSIKKAFLRSPLEFSRITSGFSNARYHPVLQEIRAHHGVDYGAAVGTRVKATGDGIVEFVGNQGGYGKVVMIRHPGDRMTVYGHLSGFAAGLKKGGRVAQAEVIGYVGSTGLATGPHLHYEFRIAGIHRNPLAMVLPSALPLPQVSMPKFLSQTHILTAQLDTIRGAQLVMLD